MRDRRILLSIVILVICCCTHALAAKRKGPRPRPHVVAMVTDTQGVSKLVVLKFTDIDQERARLAQEYVEHRKEWQAETAALKKNPATKSSEFPPAPVQPQVNVLTGKLNGEEEAKAELEKLMTKYKPILEKANEKANAKSGPARPSRPACNKKRAFVPTEVTSNGGFEQVSERTRLPVGWDRDSSEEGSAKCSVRPDRTNPHTGDRSLCIRILTGTGRVTISTSLALSPGTYEVRFWACCDVDTKATLGGALDDVDLKMQTLGEEWVEYKQTVTLQATNKTGALRLWTDTARVRVFIDDVSVRRVK